MPEAAPLELVGEAPNAGALFEPVDPVYPHTGRSVKSDLAEHLQDSVRATRGVRAVHLTLRLRSAPLGADDQSAIEREFRRYFAEEADRQRLKQRVNLREGWSSFRAAVPLILLFGGIAFVIYYFQSAIVLLALFALLYLVTISVVWVLLWDPIEQLTFDAYQIRVQILALDQLAKASITLSYAAPPGPSTATAGR